MTSFLFLFSLPTQFVYSVVVFFFSPGWDFPVTCPQLEGKGSFSFWEALGFSIFQNFPHAICSWWYWSSMVLFPSLKKEMCNYKAFISPAPMSLATFRLLRATGKFITVSSPPFTIFHSHQLYRISPGKTLFWTLSVVSIIIWFHFSVFSCMTYYISSVTVLPRHQLPYLAQLWPLSAALVFQSYSASNSKWSSASSGQG